MADRDLPNGLERETKSFSFPADSGTNLVGEKDGFQLKLAPNTRISASAACSIRFETDSAYLTVLTFPGPGVLFVTAEDEIVSGVSSPITLVCLDAAEVTFTSDIQTLNPTP